MHVHLGMFGWFYRRPEPLAPPRPTVRMRLSTPDVTYDLIGPPTCELVTEPERRRIIGRLGPDPLGRRRDSTRFVEALGGSRATIGDALLDQRIAAGVGNIYRAEALFLTGLHPLLPASSLSMASRERLWITLRDLMRRGVKQARTATVAPEELKPAERGSGTDAFYVYQQERCRRCGGRIRRFPMTSRAMYACPRCQPLPRRRGAR